MFKKVATPEDLAVFHQIKQTSWDEMGFEMEYAKPSSEQFLFYIDEHTPAGTFEFTPYEYVSPYKKSLFQDYVQEGMKLVEVDSYAVLPNYRGNLGREIISFMLYYAKENHYTHAVGLFDPEVSVSFNSFYQIRTVQIMEKLFYKGADTIPSLFHLKELYDHLNSDEYAWYIPAIPWRAGVSSYE